MSTEPFSVAELTSSSSSPLSVSKRSHSQHQMNRTNQLNRSVETDNRLLLLQLQTLVPLVRQKLLLCKLANGSSSSGNDKRLLNCCSSPSRNGLESKLGRRTHYLEKTETMAGGDGVSRYGFRLRKDLKRIWLDDRKSVRECRDQKQDESNRFVPCLAIENYGSGIVGIHGRKRDDEKGDSSLDLPRRMSLVSPPSSTSSEKEGQLRTRGTSRNLQFLLTFTGLFVGLIWPTSSSSSYPNFEFLCKNGIVTLRFITPFLSSYSDKHPVVMAASQLSLSYLNPRRCSQVVVIRLLCFWEARNMKLAHWICKPDFFYGGCNSCSRCKNQKLHNLRTRNHGYITSELSMLALRGRITLINKEEQQNLPLSFWQLHHQATDIVFSSSIWCCSRIFQILWVSRGMNKSRVISVHNIFFCIFVIHLKDMRNDGRLKRERQREQETFWKIIMGISPENDLFARFKTLSLVKPEREAGMLPLSSLLEISRTLRFLNSEKIAGNGPELVVRCKIEMSQVLEDDDGLSTRRSTTKD
ncbi:LOW QUALITY PROTEIN: hypothetical protein HID58_069906 [Brassica napus]|uniref:Uncharacterized protein n=1 Tax=Brassica napus TaxID=3708 RepID=A0ABQ7YX79_BRANA|nr:LOW QUALITY PROTEIN: hypothetical protein HID58_069906 [Brassica napus]